ncbi:hypothetical protein [Leisingera sp. ANG-M7]|uniref:hypothetical protein n=1 Tax=Leisingera sp. ANG-M7 TaxID=1577902 RepID=UPI00126A319B|nr:hypothetical protein [Leisingera sp. ANG-M7]
MGMIAVLLANALSFSRRQLERTLPLSAEAEYFMARDTLRRWAEGMPLKREPSPATPALHGTQSEVTFETLIHDGQFWGGVPTTVTLYMEEKQLVAKASGVASKQLEPMIRSLVLSPNAKNLSFSYYGRNNNEPNPAWYPSWESGSLLPVLIKIEWEQQGGQPVPPLTLRPAHYDLNRSISLSDVIPK